MEHNKMYIEKNINISKITSSFVKDMIEENLKPIDIVKYIYENNIIVNVDYKKFMNLYIECHKNDKKSLNKKIKNLFKKYKTFLQEQKKERYSLKERYSFIVASILFKELSDAYLEEDYLEKNIIQEKKGLLKSILSKIKTNVEQNQEERSPEEQKQYLKILNGVINKLTTINQNKSGDFVKDYLSNSNKRGHNRSKALN
jgi:hypothetical protein